MNIKEINFRQLEERKAHALRLREEGYNCAQSVLMVFDDVTGLDGEAAARLTSGLGAGLGCGELCGVANAMAIAQGMLHSGDAASKGPSMKAAKELLSTFAANNGSRLRCADLKGKPDVRPCNDLVVHGVELLHNYFEEKLA